MWTISPYSCTHTYTSQPAIVHSSMYTIRERQIFFLQSLDDVAKTETSPDQYAYWGSAEIRSLMLPLLHLGFAA